MHISILSATSSSTKFQSPQSKSYICFFLYWWTHKDYTSAKKKFDSLKSINFMIKTIFGIFMVFKNETYILSVFVTHETTWRFKVPLTFGVTLLYVS